MYILNPDLKILNRESWGAGYRLQVSGCRVQGAGRYCWWFVPAAVPS